VWHPQRDLIEPAVNGTKNVLASVEKHLNTIKAVVVTSSIAAVVPQVHANDPAKIWTEADWNENSTLTAGPYRLSKALAEKAAWEWAQAHPAVRVVTMCPGFVLGPIPSKRTDSESVLRCISWLDGSARANGALPDAFGCVDVRDAARAHVLAYENTQAHGRYLLTTREGVPHLRLARLLLPEFSRYPVPHEAQGTAAYVPKYSPEKAEKELGLQFRPMKVTMLDMAHSLIRLGLVPNWLD